MMLTYIGCRDCSAGRRAWCCSRRRPRWPSAAGQFEQQQTSAGDIQNTAETLTGRCEREHVLQTYLGIHVACVLCVSVLRLCRVGVRVGRRFASVYAAASSSRRRKSDSSGACSKSVAQMSSSRSESMVYLCAHVVDAPCRMVRAVVVASHLRRRFKLPCARREVLRGHSATPHRRQARHPKDERRSRVCSSSMS